MSAPLWIIGISIVLIVIVLLVINLKDALPKKRKATEDAWNFDPYNCALRHGYDIHISNEEEAMAVPPNEQPEGYMLLVEHEERTLWLIPIK